MITYKTINTGVQVKLDGKIVGRIAPTKGSDPIGWRYTPNGQRVGGEIFARLDQVKTSIEAK